MEEWREIPRSTAKISWRRTVATQAALCLALYGAFSIGRPQGAKNRAARSGRESMRDPLDLYFLSVGGGFWPADEQTELLEQMRKAAEFYKAKFVINIGELGADDPLLQNATVHFSNLKIPWYTTTAPYGGTVKYFLRKIMMAHEEILDIVGVNTGLWLNAYLSFQSCAGQLYDAGGIAYLGNPGSIQNRQIPASQNETPDLMGEKRGFFIHRVTPLEIESYFIDLAGMIVSTSKIHQQNGRAVM
ncbi:hypothetical protein AXF42_Ash020710 [Apostasia shenzhenica]|uniref:Uncharacterized protein n=1 Tax=Apostasia shenzhenica TaxID=1088818 RepID=A0A2H9ZY88_9ASPA|nr:hypothetical protein AXF42_Ash020710 [Apostasia shenzhenica]